MLCDDEVEVTAEEDLPFDDLAYNMAVAAETATTATMRMVNTAGVPSALLSDFNGRTCFVVIRVGRIILLARTPRVRPGLAWLSELGPRQVEPNKERCPPRVLPIELKS